MAMGFAVLGGFVPGIAMGLMQSAGEVGTTSYRMLAQLHGRVQYFRFANTLVLAVALYFLPRLRGVPVTSVRASDVAIGMVARWRQSCASSWPSRWSCHLTASRYLMPFP
ncbi:hypothetical protein LBMAG38_23850 [Chloroflexota bacterium]|nr:hypothetical protein LBMAG38_23850 [Chloroflexota bacterium]